MDNQDDSFVFLSKNELGNESLDTIRFGNHSLDKQFERDIECTSLAIVQCGSSPQDKSKADILLKSMLLLFFGHVCYRDRSDLRFRPFNSLDTYFEHSIFKHFPIAAILLHGSRVLVEFPNDIASQLIDWLIVDKTCWRYMATHGISALPEAEVIDHQSIHRTYKFLKEERVGKIYAVINSMSSSVSSFLNNTYSNFFPAKSTQEKKNFSEHYGFDLALGGVGNQHFASKEIIQNSGEHGHLYLYFYQDLSQKKQSGLLLGIEQSAPGKPDQYGGQHDLTVSDKEYSASGGDFFCKKPNLEHYQKEYQGLTTLPFANYYDSLWNGITKDTFFFIEKSFEKCKCLLTLLTKEKALDFIKQLFSGRAGSQPKDFDKLFNRYFEETSQMQLIINKQNAIKADLQDLQECLKQLIAEKQHLEREITHLKTDKQCQVQTIQNQQYEEFFKLSEQLNSLAIEKADLGKNNLELTDQLMRQQEQIRQLQNDKQRLLLVNRSYAFMQTVIQQMGWFSYKSQKKNILLALQRKTLEEGIDSEQLTYLLKNFISVCLMNRYYFKSTTHTAKACLLNLPNYPPLALLLKLPKHSQQANLLDLFSNNEMKKKILCFSKI